MEIERASRGDYIQGQFVKISDPNGEVVSRNPGDLDQPEVTYPFSYEHVHEAVSAAKQGYHSWKRLSASDRMNAIARYRDLMKKRAEEFARAISFEVGLPLWESRQEVEDTVEMINYFLAVGSQTSVELKVKGETKDVGVVRFFPRGAMAVISQAPHPLFSSHSHLIPALIHGNTVVTKPIKFAPTVGQLLAEIVHDAALPAGVFNVIQGDAELARRLVAHPDIDGVFFTGSFETGVKIRKTILSDYWKLLVLDTGGKSGTVVWPDCDYKKALHDVLVSSFKTTGQGWGASSRVLIHDKLFDKFSTDLHQLAKKCRVGYGMVEGDKAPFIGPLVTELAMENYLRYQGIATREGCDELMRGKPLERDKKGYYVSPSIHVVAKTDPKSVYQTNEIFGPNVALYRVQDLDEAIDILNLPKHGLVASIYTGARENYLKLAEDVRVGLLHWNRMTISHAYRLPHVGLRKSGNSRPMGSFAGYQCTHPLSSLETSEDAHSNFPIPPMEG